MSFSDHALELQRSLTATRDLLQRLCEELTARRAAWASIRPDVVAPTAKVEELSKQLAAEEERRATLLPRLREALPTPVGARPEQLHLNVTRIADALQPDRARSLRAVAEEVRTLSAALRVETAIGSRLLQFAKHAQSGIDAEVLSVADNARTPGYDRQARNLSGPDAAGQLVDGRM